MRHGCFACSLFSLCFYGACVSACRLIDVAWLLRLLPALPVFPWCLCICLLVDGRGTAPTDITAANMPFVCVFKPAMGCVLVESFGFGSLWVMFKPLVVREPSCVHALRVRAVNERRCMVWCWWMRCWRSCCEVAASAWRLGVLHGSRSERQLIKSPDRGCGAHAPLTHVLWHCPRGARAHRLQPLLDSAGCMAASVVVAVGDGGHMRACHAIDSVGELSIASALVMNFLVRLNLGACGC